MMAKDVVSVQVAEGFAQGAVFDNAISVPREPLKTTVMSAIRRKCLDCCCDRPSEVRLCPDSCCALYPFRMGRNPFRKPRTMNESQRIALSERLVAARKAKGVRR